MTADNPDWTQATDIQAGSVTITAGTVDVQNAPGTQLGSYLGDAGLGNIDCHTAASPQTLALPAGTKAVGLFSGWPTANLTHLRIADHETGVVYFEAFQFSGLARFGDLLAAVPVSSVTGDSATASIDVTFAASNTFRLHLVAFGHEADLWQEFYAPPWSAPNQAPAQLTVTAGPTAIITPATNVRVNLFRLTALTWVPGAAGGTAPLFAYHGPDAAHLTSLGVIGAPNPGANGAASVPDAVFEAAPLPAGDGVYLTNSGAAGSSWSVTAVYSLS